MFCKINFFHEKEKRPSFVNTSWTDEEFREDQKIFGKRTIVVRNKLNTKARNLISNLEEILSNNKE